MSLANEGEARRCTEIAKKYISQNNIPKAEKFLNKSIRMYPTSEAKSLLLKLQNNTSSSPPPTTNEYNPPPHATNTNSKTKQTRAQEVAIIRKVLRSKDYYEILDVPRDVEERPLKKSYRRIAMKLHPDKNHSPGATEAFKKLSKAYDCLRDTQQRAIYDQYGEDSPQMRRHAHPHQFQQMTPDDIMRMFFGGDMRFGGGRVYSFGNNRRDENEPQSGFGPLLQLLPILFVLVTMILPSMMMYGGGGSGNGSSSALYESYFTLESKYPFTLLRTTSLGTEYYVSSSRNTWRSPRKVSLEKEVESLHLQRLNDGCDREVKGNSVEYEFVLSNANASGKRMKRLKRLLKKGRKYYSDSYIEVHDGIYEGMKVGGECKKLFEYIENIT